MWLFDLSLSESQKNQTTDYCQYQHMYQYPVAHFLKKCLDFLSIKNHHEMSEHTYLHNINSSLQKCLNIMGLNFYTTSKQTYTSISRILLYEKIDVNSIYKVIDMYAYLDVRQKFRLQVLYNLLVHISITLGPQILTKKGPKIFHFEMKILLMFFF